MVWLWKCLKRSSLIKVTCMVGLLLCLSPALFAMSLFQKPPEESSMLRNFPRQNIEVGTKRINIYLAKSELEHAQGLMFVDKLETDSGMLFVFEDEAIRSFWMKNTKINLDIGFFDSDGVLKDIQQMTAGYGLAEVRLTSYQSRVSAKYALEMNQGWFVKNGIKVGDKLKFNTSKVQ